MDQRLVAQLSGMGAMKYGLVAAEDKPDPHDINYHKIQQYSEQLALYAKQAQTSYVGLEEMERLCQLGEGLQKELQHIRSDLVRRKNLELLLPSPNTQHHLPCSSLLSPTSTPSSPTSQQTLAMSTGTSSNNLTSSPTTTPTGSPTSPHANESSMSITSTGVLQSDDYWRNRKIDPAKIVRRSPTPLYVNLTEQMILAQSSKRKRPAEGDLYCHNCKTKDTPEWRRGPMGAKTLCNACGIRWRLSQAEAAKQKKGGIDSPPLTPSLQFPHIPLPLPPQSPPLHTPPGSSQSSPTQHMVQQNMLQHQQMRQLHQHLQLQQHQHQQQAQQSPPSQPPPQPSMPMQYSQQSPHQQHMVLPGHVGLAQENTPTTHIDVASGGLRGNPSVLSPLTPSPIATA